MFSFEEKLVMSVKKKNRKFWPSKKPEVSFLNLKFCFLSSIQSFIERMKYIELFGI